MTATNYFRVRTGYRVHREDIFPFDYDTTEAAWAAAVDRVKESHGMFANPADRIIVWKEPRGTGPWTGICRAVGEVHETIRSAT